MVILGLGEEKVRTMQPEGRKGNGRILIKIEGKRRGGSRRFFKRFQSRTGLASLSNDAGKEGTLNARVDDEGREGRHNLEKKKVEEEKGIVPGSTSPDDLETIEEMFSWIERKNGGEKFKCYGLWPATEGG